jgi:AcrR family transcriptional regulator
MAYRKTDKVQAQLAAKREALIDATIDLIEVDGLWPGSPRVARHAEVAEGGIYRHFPTADDLRAAVVGQVLQGDLNAIAAASAGIRGPYAQLHGALVALYRCFTRRRLREFLFAEPRYREGLRRALAPLISACVAQEVDSRVVPAAVVGALFGVYQNCGQAQGAAFMAADFALQGIGASDRVMSGIAAAAVGR